MGLPVAIPVDHASPLSDIVVTTPQSPRGAPSPMTMAVREMTTMERSRLLVQGRHMDLFKAMDAPQRMFVISLQLILVLLIACVAPYRHGCINIGSLPLKQQNIGVEVLKTGLPTFLVSMITIDE